MFEDEILDACQMDTNLCTNLNLPIGTIILTKITLSKLTMSPTYVGTPNMIFSVPYYLDLHGAISLYY